MAEAGKLDFKVLSKLEENSMSTTKFYDIAEAHHKTKALTEPVEMRLKELDFYGGNHSPEYDYMPGVSYESRHFGYRATNVLLENILNDFQEGQITFVGPAGAGKTTLMKTITRRALSRKYDGLKDIEVVHYADLRGFRADKNFTIDEYLFRNNVVQLTAAERRSVVEFATKKPDKVLFVIDSLDTLQYYPDKGDVGMEQGEKRSPATILRNLLSGSLLSKCRFITSSREYAIRNFKGELRARKVIALDGLTTESMHKMIHGYLDENDAKDLIEFLENQPILKTMCETPLFLALTAMVSKEVMSFKSQSVAVVLIFVLRLFVRSPHVETQEQAVENLERLEILAARLTEERRVLFGTTDLKDIGLSVEEATAFVVASPKGNEKKLILGEDVLFFAHQSIQELLTAFHIIKNEQKDFEGMVREKIHTDQYSVVRRFLSGTLLDDDILQEASEFFGCLSEEDIKIKQDLLRKSIQKKVNDGPIDMEIAFLFAESGNGLNEKILPRNVQVSNGYSTLTAGRGYAVGRFLRICSIVKELKFEGKVQPEGLFHIYQQIHDLSLQIQNLKFQHIMIGSTNMATMGKLLSCSTVTNLLFGMLSLTASEASVLGANLDGNVTTTIHFRRIDAYERLLQDEVAGLLKFHAMLAKDVDCYPVIEFNFSTQTTHVFYKYGNRIMNNDGGGNEITLFFMDNFKLLQNSLESQKKIEQNQRLSATGTLAKKFKFRNIEFTTSYGGYQPTIHEWKEFASELDGYKVDRFTLREFIELGIEHCSVFRKLFENDYSVGKIDLAKSEITLDGLEELKNRASVSQFNEVHLNIKSDQVGRCCHLASQVFVRGHVKELILLTLNKFAMEMTAIWNESNTRINKLRMTVSNDLVYDISPMLDGLEKMPISDMIFAYTFKGSIEIYDEFVSSSMAHPKDRKWVCDLLLLLLDHVSETVIIEHSELTEEDFGILQASMHKSYPTNLQIVRTRQRIKVTKQNENQERSAVELQVEKYTVPDSNLPLQKSPEDPAVPEVPSQVLGIEYSQDSTGSLQSELQAKKRKIPASNLPLRTFPEDPVVPKVPRQVLGIGDSRDRAGTLQLGIPTKIDSTIDDVAEAIRHNLTRSICTAKLIGKNGGEISLRRSEVKFSHIAFEEETSVSLTLRSEYGRNPEGLEPISSAIKCSTSQVQFKGLALVKLPIHFKGENDIIILSRKKIDSPWEAVETEPSIEDSFVTFHVSHFCTLQAFTRRIVTFLSNLLRGEVTLLNFLYFNKETAALRGLTCVDDPNVKEECLAALKENGFADALELPDRVKLSGDEEISYRVECVEPNESNIRPENVVSVKARNILSKKWELQRFDISPPPEVDQVCLQYTLKRPSEDEKLSFLRVSWRNSDDRPKDVTPDVTTFVERVRRIGTPRNIYISHLDNPQIYRIDPERRKGEVLVINNFFANTNYAREGSQVDVRNMRNLWNTLGFQVRIESDHSAREMLEVCRRFARDAHGISVVVVIIMTHGGRDHQGNEYFDGEDGRRMLKDDVIEVFSATESRHLQSIPKLFIFQACRAEMQADAGPDEEQPQITAPAVPVSRPERADMLITYATQPRHVAWRNSVEGSWLMNAITHIFMQNGRDTDVLTMLTGVNEAMVRRSGTLRTISSQESYLTRRLCLFPGWP